MCAAVLGFHQMLLKSLQAEWETAAPTPGSESLVLPNPRSWGSAEADVAVAACCVSLRRGCCCCVLCVSPPLVLLLPAVCSARYCTVVFTVALAPHSGLGHIQLPRGPAPQVVANRPAFARDRSLTCSRPPALY